MPALDCWQKPSLQSVECKAAWTSYADLCYEALDDEWDFGCDYIINEFIDLDKGESKPLLPINMKWSPDEPVPDAPIAKCIKLKQYVYPDADCSKPWKLFNEFCITITDEHPLNDVCSSIYAQLVPLSKKTNQSLNPEDVVKAANKQIQKYRRDTKLEHLNDEIEISLAEYGEPENHSSTYGQGLAHGVLLCAGIAAVGFFINKQIDGKKEGYAMGHMDSAQLL